MNNYNKSNKTNKTKDVFEKVVNHLQNIVSSGDYEKFLKFIKNFSNYSFNNLILIYSQFPDATRVAGKSTWLKFKRQPAKNAKRIFIIAPIPRKYDKKVKKIENGEEVETLTTYEYNSYRYVYVYDISQTDGEPIPLQCNNLNNADKSYLYEKLKTFCDIPIVEEELYGSLKGYYNESKQKIAIKNTLSPNDKAAVLLHELAHKLYDDFDYKTDRNLSEVFVESIAFIVADHFGLDTSLCSFNYVAKWAHGDPKVVIDLGSKIQKCANDFINKIESFEYEKLLNAA